MDYSLYLVVEALDAETLDWYLENTFNNVILASNWKEAYHIGIIDYLQEWNYKKKAEHCAKKFFRRNDPKKLSAVDPDQYSERFAKFMVDEVFIHSMKEVRENFIL